MSAKEKERVQDCVRVVVRCRPLSSKEIQDGYKRVVEMDRKDNLVLVSVPGDQETKVFPFDCVFDQSYVCLSAESHATLGILKKMYMIIQLARLWIVF